MPSSALSGPGAILLKCFGRHAAAQITCEWNANPIQMFLEGAWNNDESITEVTRRLSFSTVGVDSAVNRIGAIR